MKRNRIHEKAEAGQSLIMTPFGIAFSFEVSSNYDGARLVWKSAGKLHSGRPMMGGTIDALQVRSGVGRSGLGNLVCKKHALNTQIGG